MFSSNVVEKIVPEGLKSLKGKNIGVSFNNEDNQEKSFNEVSRTDFFDVMHFIKNHNFESKMEFIKRQHLGGKKDKKKDDVVCSKNTFEIQTLGVKILNFLLENFPFIIKNNTLNDFNKLNEIVFQFLNEKKIILNNLEHELLVRYIKDNLTTNIKNKIIEKNSLFNYITNYKKNHDFLENYYNSGDLSYRQLVTITKIISERWNGLKDLHYMTRNSFKFNKIHPLFFLLFARKYAGLEQILVKQDYPTLIDQLLKDEIGSENFLLLTLRASDLSNIPVTDQEYSSSLENEGLRINISVLLREIMYSVRSGIFENKCSDLLLKLLSKIKMAEAVTEEENLFQSILGVFSCPSILISKAQPIDLFSNLQRPHYSLNNNTAPFFPNAAYNLSFPLKYFTNYYFDGSNKPYITSKSFEMLGYDPKTKNIYFLSNFEDHPTVNDETLLKQYYNANRPIGHLPAMDYFATSGLANSFFETITPVKLFSANGTIVISIDRNQNNLVSCFSSGLFLNKGNNNINISSIVLDQKIEVNKIEYELVAALAIDILEDNGSLCTYQQYPYISNKYKIGNVALVKEESNRWVYYNPNNINIKERLMERIDIALRSSYYNESDEIQNTVTIDDYIKDPALIEKIKKDILDNKISVADMIISEDKAMEIIMSKGTLLFYSEDYDNYIDRLNKCPLNI